jgi:tetratricopeptide (TPR) repeat protein
MANLMLREDLVAKLEELAQRQHRSVDDLVASLLEDQVVGLRNEEQSKYNDYSGIAEIRTLQGDLVLYQGNVEAARSLYQAALSLYEASEDIRGKANILKKLGDLEARNSNVEAARSLYQAALSLYEASEDIPGKANTLKKLGDLEVRNKVDVARKWYEAALPLYELTRDSQGQADTLKGLADLEARIENKEAALKWYRAALFCYEATRDLRGKADVRRGLRDIGVQLDELDTKRNTNNDSQLLERQDHLRLYERARRYWRSIGDSVRAALTDEQLDEQFWLFDHEGIPHLKSEQATIELPYDPLLAMLEEIEANPSQWSFGATDISERSREILNNEFADYLIARMNRPLELDNG